MKTLRIRILLVVVGCALLASSISGFISLYNSAKVADNDAYERLSNTCQNYGKDIDEILLRIEVSVNTLADMTVNTIQDLKQFQTSRSYVNQCTDKLKSIALGCANNTDGALTYYVRYNPDFTEATSGIFASRESNDSKFQQLTPTDFSSYEKDDLEHVGWYYIPVNNGKPTWMDPYLNANINVYMISYVVPIVIDNVSVGIVGMDIDFRKIQEIADGVNMNGTGYGFLINGQNQIMTHPKLEFGTELKKNSEELDAFVSGENAEKALSYQYEGEEKVAAFTALHNGMKLVEIAPNSEIRENTTHLFVLMFVAILVAVLVAIGAGLIFSTNIIRPIQHLTEIITDTADLNFKRNPKSAKLVKMQNETGDMARAVQKMRAKLREMVGLIDKAGLNMEGNVEDLYSNMHVVNDICSNNSATAEELAAAMEEAASATDTVTQAIGTINENAKNISELSLNGAENSLQVKKRADDLMQATLEASSRTGNMYNEVREKTETAKKQAEAVKRINELTQNIMDISTQTNLLALNASIEAARAGEAGKGFAVVATEIGTLANQTQETVGDINGIIAQVNSAVNSLVQSLDYTMEFLENTILKDYDEFKEVGKNYSGDANAYERGMTEINDAIKTLVSAIADISTSIREINTTVSESAEGVSEIANKTSEMVLKIEATEDFMEGSRENTDNLNHIVKEFRLE
ncbi:MAG: methyl-accepting chemotaxis protein [Lachnospiraceae bacterium]|nr:methyl-accepting chemotaxis protein [Lachnospiraceae bacterium]